MNRKVVSKLAQLGIIKSELIAKENVTEENRHRVSTIGGSNFIHEEHGLTDDEIKIMLLAEQVSDIRTIKTIVIVSTVISILAVVLTII